MEDSTPKSSFSVKISACSDCFQSAKMVLVCILIFLGSSAIQAQTYAISSFNSVSPAQYWCLNSTFPGITATFNVTSCGGGAPTQANVTYQWYVANTNAAIPATAGTSASWTAVGPTSPTKFVGTSFTVDLPLTTGFVNAPGTKFYYCAVTFSSQKCGSTAYTGNSTSIEVRILNAPFYNASTAWIPTNSAVCAGPSAQPITISMQPAATTTYTWSIPAGSSSFASISSVSGTNNSTANVVFSGAAASPASINVSASACGGTTPASKTYTISNSSITTPPSTSSFSTCQGTAFTSSLSVAVGWYNGIGSLQWYSNTTASNSGGTLIAGATTTTYTPPNNVLGTRYYYCVATNPSADGSCTVTSAVSGAWIVNPATAISVQSTAAQTVCQNATPTALSLSATGVGLTYQWYSNNTAVNTGGALITGATSSSYSPPTSATGTKYYYCIVGGTCGASVTSAVSGAFKVDPVVAISANIATSPQTACAGTSFSALTFSATGVSLTYKWYSDDDQIGLNGTEIAGATTNSYTPPTSGANLYYYAVATGSCGNAPTAYSGLFTVKPAPTLATAAQDSIVASGAVKINLTGLLPNTTHSVAYSISGATANSPAASIISDASGKASFLANSTGAGLTPANNNAILSIPTLTITGSGAPNCANITPFTANVRLMVSNTTRTYRSAAWTSTTPTWTNSVPTLNTGVCDTDANAGSGLCYGAGTEVPVYIGHNVVIDQNVVVDNGVYYFGARGRGQPSANTITDTPGGTAYSLTISRSGGFVATQAIVDIQSGVTTFEGALTINNGSLYVRNGATLIVGSCSNAADPGVTCMGMSIGNNSSVYVEAGGTLIVKGDVANTNNGTGEVTVIGYLSIEGDYAASQGNVNIVGSGEFVTTGSMTTAGSSSIFGSTNDCQFGPCSGTALACGSGTSFTFSLSVNGVIATAVPVCEGSPANFSFNTTAPAPVYQWQVSDVGPSTGFVDIAGATSTAYSTIPVATRYYRMKYIPSGCGALYSNPVTITVADVPTIVTQPLSPGTICQFSTDPILSVSVTVDANNSIQSYNWYPTANPATPVSTTNTSSPSNSYSPSAGTAGSFSFYVDVLTTAGCKVSSNPAAFTVSAAPSSATISGTATICSGVPTNLSVSFAGTAVAPYNFRYRNNSTGQEFDAAGSTSTASVAVAPTADATYTLVSASAGANCPVPAVGGLLGSAVITVNPVPTSAVLNSSYAGNATTICFGSSVSFVAAVTGGTAPFSLILSDGTTLTGYASGSSVSRTPTISTNYSIVSLTDANGCAGTGIGSGSVAVTVNDQSVWNSGVPAGVWSTETNWSCGLPNRNLDATIPAGSIVSVDLVDAETRSLTVDGIINFDVGAALSIYGNLAVTGTFNSYTNSNKVTFKGSAAQTISGGSKTVSVSPIQMMDLEIANTAGVINNDAARIDLYGVVTFTLPTSKFDADGSSNSGELRLRSNGAASAASIGPLPTGAMLLGSVTIQRHLGLIPLTANNGWRYVATPVTGFTVGDQLSEWILNRGLSYYDESMSGVLNSGWRSMTAASQPAKGRGYFSYRTPALVEARGAVTTGPVTLPLTVTDYGSASAADGWNLVGNPFPAPINWNWNPSEWTVSGNIDPVIYVVDVTNNTWNGWDANSQLSNSPSFNGVIAMGQAFWMHAYKSPAVQPVVTVYEAAKRVGSVSSYMREDVAKKPTLEIGLSDGVRKDYSIILLDDAATHRFDQGKDAYKLDLQDWGVSTMAGDIRLMNNSLSAIAGDPIYLDIKGVPGPYSLQFNDRYGSGLFEGLYLVDHYLGISTPVKLGVPVSFEVTNDPASRSGRFALSAGAPKSSEEELLTSWPNPAVGGMVQLRAVSSEDVDFQVLGLDGKPMHSGTLKSVDGLASGAADLSSLAKGLYLIKARVNGKNQVLRQVIR